MNTYLINHILSGYTPPICGQHRLDDAGNTMNITIETITECVVIKVS